MALLAACSSGIAQVLTAVVTASPSIIKALKEDGSEEMKLQNKKLQAEICALRNDQERISKKLDETENVKLLLNLWKALDALPSRPVPDLRENIRVVLEIKGYFPDHGMNPSQVRVCFQCGKVSRTMHLTSLVCGHAVCGDCRASMMYEGRFWCSRCW